MSVVAAAIVRGSTMVTNNYGHMMGNDGHKPRHWLWPHYLPRGNVV